MCNIGRRLLNKIQAMKYELRPLLIDDPIIPNMKKSLRDDSKKDKKNKWFKHFIDLLN